MRRVAEDGAGVNLQLSFQFTDEFEVREEPSAVVNVLTDMFNSPILVDDMMRKLKGNLLIGAASSIEWNRHHRRFKINKV